MRIKSKGAFVRALRKNGWKIKIRSENFELHGKKADKRGKVETFYYFECQYGKTVEIIDRKRSFSENDYVYFRGAHGFECALPRCAFDTVTETKLHNLIYHSGHT